MALVTAGDLEERGILKKTTAYRMAERKLLPHYRVGLTRRGVRFSIEEVLNALRASESETDATVRTRDDR